MRGWWPYDVTIKRESRDVWIGLYRTGREWISPGVNRPLFSRWRWYICIVPCLPIVVTWIADFEPLAAAEDREVLG